MTSLEFIPFLYIDEEREQNYTLVNCIGQAGRAEVISLISLTGTHSLRLT